MSLVLLLAQSDAGIFGRGATRGLLSSRSYAGYYDFKK